MYVIAPKSEYVCKISKDEKYKVTPDKRYPEDAGTIINDLGSELFIKFKGCAHLGGKNWIIVGAKRELKGRDQYNKLNKKEKRRFKKLYVQAFGLNQWHEYLNQNCRFFSSFIANGFEWFGTPQGIDYWVKLSSKFE